ncbi:MAG: endonuclease/exonuclease/phosphatase family protein [Alphaproteobacteria bacterium]|nr:endonuclease/exonuclease/phosphatase family protein [Alphaproteobacteria bacterium]MCB9797830.1 endonuclease/exonuclease/phosphatase family protein [Alphaproteobacteria bacterium]
MTDGLNLMTWNVRYFGHGTGGVRATEAWIRRVAEAIAALDPLPDVLALQEVEQTSIRGGLGAATQIERFAQALHEAMGARGVERTFRPLYYPAHRYALPVVPPLYTTGLAVLVADHLEVEDHNSDEPCEITHVRVPWTAPFKQRRIAAHVRVRSPESGQTLDLFNTHLSLPAFFHGGFHLHRIAHRMGHGANQVAEIEALLDRIARRRGEGDAVIVGDFNSAPNTPAYQALLDRGWVDAFAPHEEPRAGTARFWRWRMHIDHVFSTPGVEWLHTHTHGIDDDGPFLGLSDHSPKLGTLRLRT